MCIRDRIYRIHDAPSREKLVALAEFLATLNLSFTKGENIRPANFNRILKEVDGTEHGTCSNVLTNPASDILELDTGHLVPSTFIVSRVDGVVTVDTPDGLFDLLDK